MLLLALFLGRVSARVGMPPIIGELCAGVLLGPSILSHLAPGLAAWLFPRQPEQVHLLDAVGQVGVLLLVGLTGMEMDFARIRHHGVTALRVSLAGFIIPLVFGVAAGFVLPDALLSDRADRAVFALFLGVALCVSSIPVIAKTLMDMNLLHRDIGQLILTAGTVDDVLGWFTLSIISAMATTGVSTSDITTSLLSLLSVVVVAALFGRPIVASVLRMTKQSQNAGVTVAAIAAMTFLTAATTQSLNLEAIFGALVCGILVGTSRELEPAQLTSLRTVVLALLAPLFFATAGLRMDLAALSRPVVLAATLAILMIAILGKFLGAYLGARLSSLNRWEALALGAGMNARGVIEVITAMVGLRIGVLNTTTYTIIILIAIATSLMAPPILSLAMTRIDLTTEASP